MSDKPTSKLWECDRILRKAHPVGMRSGVDVQIELRCGFEIFNTRPYHNYETWSNGWYVSGSVHENASLHTDSEDLDDAVRKYRDAKEKFDAGEFDGIWVGKYQASIRLKCGHAGCQEALINEKSLECLINPEPE